MLPDPLHPAVVHFPIVFMFLLPLAAGVALWRIRRGAPPARSWLLPLALAAALAASAWVAVETGESQDERVERAVPTAPLEQHEERAELFLALSAVVLALTGAGLIRGRFGQLARLAALAGAAVLLAVGASVGHQGGQLVYRYGAASTHVAQAPGGPMSESVRGDDD